MAVLRTRDGASHTLVSRTLTIGSTSHDDIRIASAGEASALVAPAGRDRFVLRAGSTKVLVNGKRVKTHALQDGDTVRIGNDDLVFHEGASPPIAPLPITQLEQAARALAHIAATARAEVPAERVLEALARAAVDLCRAEASIVVVADPHHIQAVAWGPALADTSSQPRELLSSTLVRSVLAQGKSRVVDDVQALPETPHTESLAAMSMRSLLLVPFHVDEEVAGVLVVAAPGIGRFGAEQLALGDLLAGHIALLLRPARPLERALQELGAMRRRTAHKGLIGQCPGITEIAKSIDRVARSDLSVLIVGETGTGKEIVARALHDASSRSEGPFVAVNCGAVTGSLIESELFGHVRGAFTGAHQDRPGLFELASSGTLFLDEIGQMPREQQVRLLRVLEQRVVTRVGDGAARPVDVRVVAAAQVASDEEHGGPLRRDLLFRLDQIRLTLPPLRERGEDVLLLAEHFLREARAEARLARAARVALTRHSWPGNVRELKSCVLRAAVLCEGGLIEPSDLGLAYPQACGPEAIEPLDEAWAAFARNYVEDAIAQCNGDRRAAAAALGIGLRSLYRYLGKS